MAGKDKQRKFDELGTFPNVLQNLNYHKPHLRNFEGKDLELKGNWRKDFFKNDHPLILELACGKGEYAVGLAQMFPENNYIGIDLKGNRIWRGAKDSLAMGVANVAFIRTKIDLIPHFFAETEVDEIWITFADPFLNPTSANRRLTSPDFLDVYRKVCKPGAIVNLKTDSDTLYEFSLKVVEEQGLKILENDEDIYRNGDREGPLSIKTHYERMHLQNKKTIKYLKFVL